MLKGSKHNYIVQKEIGRGTHGKVYDCYKEGLPPLVVKIFSDWKNEVSISKKVSGI